jgi:hypothetical protein
MPTRSAQENLYIQRINAVIGHVRENLHDDLSFEGCVIVSFDAGLCPVQVGRPAQN